MAILFTIIFSSWALSFSMHNILSQLVCTDFQISAKNLTNFELSKINTLFLDRVDPITKVFPLMTKCNFFKYGASGTIEKLDALCLLPINILNEKIYIFFWFWLLYLAIISAFHLISRILQYLIPNLRKRYKVFHISTVRTVNDVKIENSREPLWRLPMRNFRANVGSPHHFQDTK